MKKRIWIILVAIYIVSVGLTACSPDKQTGKIPEHGHFDTGYLPFYEGFEDAEIKYAKVSNSEKNGDCVKLSDDTSYTLLTIEQVTEFDNYFGEIMMGECCELCEPSYTYDYVIITSLLKDDVFAVNVEDKKIYWVHNDFEDNNSTIYVDTLNDEQINFLNKLFD